MRLRRGSFRAPAPAVALARVLALVLVMGMAACGDGGGDGRAGRAPATPAGEPSTAVPETTTTSAGSVAAPPSSLPAPTAAPTTAAARRGQPAPAPAAAPAAARALSPPAPGTYRYDTTGAATVGASSFPAPAVTTLVIDPPVGTRQHSVRDLRDPSGTGPTSEFVVDYRPDGVYLEELKATSTTFGFTQTRTLRPPAPALFLPTGARPGQHFELDVPVTGGSTPGNAHVTVDVLREEPVAVAGATVNALVVRAVIVLPAGELTGRSELTMWVGPDTGLFVREHSVGDFSAGGGVIKLHSEYRATLQRLSPG